MAAVGFSMALQMGLNPNFISDEMGLQADQLGWVEAVRESCGILALGVLAVLAGLAEPVVGAVVLVVFAVGLSAYAWVGTLGSLVAFSFVWSQGLHVWMPLPQSMTLALAEPDQAGRRLGQVGAAGAAGFAAGLVLALAMTLLHDRGFAAGLSVRQLFPVAGAAGLVAAGLCLGVPRRIKTPGPRLVLRWRYRLYYAMCFLEGWRKQIFVCFAGYLLVTHHNARPWEILGLMLIVQAIGYAASPRVGRWIDRVGERRALVLYFSCLMLFFTGYATLQDRWMLYALFVVDNSFFVLAMAMTTYVRKIAPVSEHTATLSMGVAMNHVAAVLMPLIGGWIWMQFGYAWTFLLGAAAAAMSIPFALRMPSTARPVPALQPVQS